MPYPIGKSAVGIGLETVRGTAVAAGFWVPATKMDATENVGALWDQPFTGSAAKTYGYQPGMKSVVYALGGNLIPDAVGWPLVGVLGEDVVTGTAPYSHAVALYNGANFQPSSYTIVDVNGPEAISYAGGQFSDFQLMTSGDKFATWTANLMASTAASSGTLPTTSYSTVAPIAGWRTVVTVGGTANTTQTDVTIDLKRTVSAIDILTGTQIPEIFTGGDFEVTGKLTGVFEATTLRDDFRGGITTSLDVLIANGLAGAAAGSLQMHMSSIALPAVTLPRGKTYVELDASFTAIANVTDAGASGGRSPIKVTLNNTIPSATYHS